MDLTMNCMVAKQGPSTSDVNSRCSSDHVEGENEHGDYNLLPGETAFFPAQEELHAHRGVAARRWSLGGRRPLGHVKEEGHTIRLYVKELGAHVVEEAAN